VKKVIKFLGIIAFAVIIGVSMTACNNGFLPEDKKNGDTFSVSGKFKRTGGNEVQFKLAETGSNRSARSTATTSIIISGELEDGDIVFRLSGTYDSAENKYNASASSSMVRYSINGAFDSNGNSLGSTATLLVRDNINSDDWTAFSYVITESASVTISGDEYENDVTGGIPAFAQGFWNFTEQSVSDGSSSSGNTGQNVTIYDSRLLLSQWTMVQDTVITNPDGTKDYDTFNATVIEAEDKKTHWDIIFGVPFYEATNAQALAAVKQFLSDNKLKATEKEMDDPTINHWDPTPPWVKEYNAHMQKEPLPPWLESLGSWEAIWKYYNNDQQKFVGLPPIPAQYQEYAFYFSQYYGTEHGWPNEKFTLPWWGNWAPKDYPLPPWLQKDFKDWGAVLMTGKYKLPTIPAQYQQYAWYYDHLYGNNPEYGDMPPWLEGWKGYPDPEPLPPWLESLGSWEAVYATMYYTLPPIPSQYKEYAWFYNDYYGTNYDYPKPPPGDLYYTIEDGDVWFWSNGSYDWNKLNRWYTGNYLATYLIGKVTPTMLYIKMRATFSHNDTRMNIKIYGDYYEMDYGNGSYSTGYDGFYKTVQEARNVKTYDPDDEGITLTR